MLDVDAQGRWWRGLGQADAGHQDERNQEADAHGGSRRVEDRIIADAARESNPFDVEDGPAVVRVGRATARRSNSMQRYLDESAAVLYLRNRDLRLTRMGELVADADRAVDDGCKASCVDWYGNARPIFIGERVFALLGYELVEGRVSGERIVERRRTNFAPAAAISD
jgi:hypothetical protein